MTLQVPLVVISSGSGSPWKNPAAWDTIKIAGVWYGWGSPGTPASSKIDTSGTPLDISQRLAINRATAPAFIGGKVRIRGARRVYRIDAKEPKGQDGFVTTYRGVKSEPFEIIFYIWTPDQYDYFTDSILPVLTYSGVKNAQNPSGIQALEVYHPILANLAIGSVEVVHIGGIEPQEDGPNMFTCTVHVREYLPPPPTNTTATPKGNKSVNQPTTPGLVARPAVAANQATIDNLRNQVAAATK